MMSVFETFVCVCVCVCVCVWVCVCVRKSFLWKPVFNCVVILQFSKRAKYFSAVIFPIHFMKYRSSINSIFKWYHWNETQLLTIRTKIFQVIFTWMSKEFCSVCIIHTTQFKPWWQLDAIVGCWWADTLSIASLPMWFEDCTDELIREFMLNDFKKICAKREAIVDPSTVVTRRLRKYHLGCKNLNYQARTDSPINIDSEAMHSGKSSVNLESIRQSWYLIVQYDSSLPV